MENNMSTNPLPAANERRRQAEERLGAKTVEQPLPRTKEETERLVHELEVHQIELEMQNEEMLQAREAVGASLKKYTDLYDFAPIGYLTLDGTGTIHAVNFSGATLLGVERSMLIGRRFGLFMPGNARQFFAEFLGKVFANQGKKSCEVTLSHEGSRPLFVQIEAVAEASGNECSIVVIDITERRLLEEERERVSAALRKSEKEIERLNVSLMTHTADLEEANRELEAFNYTVAHDLRNPLNVVSSYCQVIKEFCYDNLDKTCKRYFQEIYNGTMSMNRLIGALLDFSRLTHVELNREAVDLSRMAKEVAVEIRGTESARRVEFRIAEGIVADGDAALLRVVLTNTLDNAWKYTGMREEAVIEFGTEMLNGKTAYFVRDNGAGFDNADAEKLFVPFQRLPGAEEYRGFGIGLATVDRIIRRHGGKVWAVGEPGKGSAFYFTLQG